MPSLPSDDGMRKFVIPGMVVAAAVALLVLLVYGVSNHTDTASIDAKVASGHYPVAPGYRTELPMLGTSHRADLASFRGKVVLVNFYASWCTACRAEAHLLSHEQRVLARHGATIVGVSWKDSSNATERFNRQFGLDYPVLRDVNGNLASSLGTYQMPETFLLNAQGKIVALSREEIDQRWLNQHVRPLLRRSA